jgi:hypothetical protein
MSDKYYTYIYGTKIDLNALFQSGTTSGTNSNFKINENELNTLFEKKNSFGYKEYFTQNFLTTYITIPQTPNINYTYNGTDLITLYKLNPTIFFLVINNDTNFTTNPIGYNYCIRFINNGSIKFNTDTVVNIWMVGGGGSGGKGASAGSGGGGGGAGGVINFNFPMKNGITYNFTIGQGGQAVTVNSNGNNGESTTLSWTDILNYTIVVLGGGGGGGGGNGGVVGLPGGSGGGASGRRGTNESNGGGFNPNINVTSGPISYNYAKIISAPGTNGIPIIGTYANTSTPFTNNTTSGLINSYGNIGSYGNNNTDGGGGGAGGGGAGGGATPGNSPYGGTGGAGVSIPPLGVTVIIGGGGGGAAYSASASYGGGQQGAGGGGYGHTYAHEASSGYSNTGGGGGGTTGTAAAGGSGVVYLFF